MNIIKDLIQEKAYCTEDIADQVYDMCLTLSIVDPQQFLEVAIQAAKRILSPKKREEPLVLVYGPDCRATYDKEKQEIIVKSMGPTTLYEYQQLQEALDDIWHIRYEIIYSPHFEKKEEEIQKGTEQTLAQTIKKVIQAESKGSYFDDMPYTLYFKGYRYGSNKPSPSFLYDLIFEHDPEETQPQGYDGALDLSTDIESELEHLFHLDTANCLSEYYRCFHADINLKYFDYNNICED